MTLCTKPCNRIIKIALHYNRKIDLLVKLYHLGILYVGLILFEELVNICICEMYFFNISYTVVKISRNFEVSIV